LILGELVSNAFKHAFPREWKGRETDPEIAVGLRRLDGGRLELEVSDNGVGLPRKMNWRESDSLGLQLVDSLVRQLGADAGVVRRNGTSFRLSFPVGPPTPSAV
jgi:two-component sensor histidine kinase